MNNFVERWQVYGVRLGSIKPSVAPLTVPFQLDNDAPFRLRGRSITCVQTDDTVSATVLDQMWTRFTDPAEQYRSSDVIPAAVTMPYGGASAPSAVYPEVPYPPGAIIQTQIYNDGSVLPSTAVDVYIFYHGVKLYQPGGEYGRTYPPQCDVRPYALTLPGPGRTLALQVTDSITQYQLKVPGDFDYAFRGGVFGWTSIPGQADSTRGFANVSVTIRDNRQRAFSNIPIPVEHIFSTPQSLNLPMTRSPYAGDFTPGLFVPELYVKRSQYLFFDFVRADSAVTGMHACNVQSVFSGSKVVAR